MTEILQIFNGNEGEIYALSTAICWSLTIIIFNKATGAGNVTQVKLFHNFITVLFLFLAMLLVGSPIIPNFDGEGWSVIIITALLGISVGDTLFLIALQKLGSSLMAVAECSYSLYVLFFAYFMYSETVTPKNLLGIFLIITAILIPSLRNSEFDRPREQIISGLFVALATTALMAITVLILKRILNQYDLVTITFYRFGVGQVFLVGYLMFKKKSLCFMFDFKKVDNKGLHILGVFLGPVSATLFWVAGYKYAKAGVAAVLNQTSTIFVFLFAWLLLKESISRYKLASLILAFTGVYLVTAG
ncbi:MAG: hypothetical protein CL677_02770 [Bdellovibrionaceae bacterium]|nr:hypothetical protein [Pseudobdellovibrionaceae bacterium]|tara:strand:+ start:42927 stop:43835 length:909 start_codon:yes stop_codon:yes gene_type:complete